MVHSCARIPHELPTVAAFTKLPSGKWRAQVARLGVRKSQAFHTKAAAAAWASQVEGDILARKRGQTVKRTLRQALERYRDDVSPSKRGGAWEIRRLDFFLSKDGMPFVERWLDDITPDHIGKWRDHRLQGVKASTVNRDFNLLSVVLSTARDEWGWLHASPMSKVRRPLDPQPRTRLIDWREAKAMLRALGHAPGKPPDTKTAEVGHAFLVSLHTGMRAGEVLMAELRGSVAHLPMTKNGEARDVPLSRRALRLMKLCPEYSVDSASLDALFRKARIRAGLSGFVFHDARATALTRLSKRVDVLTLARISGHRDIKMLMTYYRESTEDIAARLR